MLYAQRGAVLKYLRFINPRCKEYLTMAMAAFWTEVYVRTETAYQKRNEEAQAEGRSSSSERVFGARDKVVAVHPLHQLFPIPEHLQVTYVYSAWYQPTLFHEDINKFRTLDVKTEMGGGAGSGVFLEASSVAGEDAQINLRVHMLCEVQQRQ